MDDTLEMSKRETYKYQLPSGFFEKICDLENSLLVNKDLIKIENLARLYKIGVEYYSGSNSSREADYLFRLQSLFSNKHLTHFYDSADKNKTVKSNHKNQSRVNMEVSLAQLEKSSQSSALHISKFEVKVNQGLNQINDNIRAQEKSFHARIKRRKQELRLANDIVSFF